MDCHAPVLIGAVRCAGVVRCAMRQATHAKTGAYIYFIAGDGGEDAPGDSEAREGTGTLGM